jgi:hypothetical protein
MLAPALPIDSKPWIRKLVLSHEGVLALLLVTEIAVFSAIGRNFWTADNAFEIVRLGAEIGLLAIAMTPGGDSEGLRFSPHIYNSFEEIDRAVARIARPISRAR